MLNSVMWLRGYLLGQRLPMSDLMAWNADSTRMPQRMHSEYRHRLYLNNDLADTEITFLLASGGHNAGIVSEPGHPKRHCRLHVKPATECCRSAQEWLSAALLHQGSWRPAWQRWRVRHSSSKRGLPPAMGHALADAPGHYVLQR